MHMQVEIVAVEIVGRGSETQVQVDSFFNPCAAGTEYIRFQAIHRPINTI